MLKPRYNCPKCKKDKFYPGSFYNSTKYCRKCANSLRKANFEEMKKLYGRTIK